MKILHATAIAVNLAAFASSAAYANPLDLDGLANDEGFTRIDLCYLVVGIAMVEDGAIEAITKDGDTFKVKLNKDKWSGLASDTKTALKGCLSDFNRLKEENAATHEEEKEGES